MQRKLGKEANVEKKIVWSKHTRAGVGRNCAYSVLLQEEGPEGIAGSPFVEFTTVSWWTPLPSKWKTTSVTNQQAENWLHCGCKSSSITINPVKENTDASVFGDKRLLKAQVLIRFTGYYGTFTATFRLLPTTCLCFPPQASSPWSPSPSSPTSVTAPWWRPTSPTAGSTARCWEGSASPGSTLWPGPYLRCWAGADTGPRVPAPPARWTGRARRRTISPTSSACSPSAWCCLSVSFSTPTASCCTPSDRWGDAGNRMRALLWDSLKAEKDRFETREQRESVLTHASSAHQQHHASLSETLDPPDNRSTTVWKTSS